MNLYFSEYNFFKVNFIDPASPLMYGIIELHDHIFFFLNMILFLVLFVLLTTLRYFTYRKNSRRNRYLLSQSNKAKYEWLKLSHGTTIEVIWTIVPSLVLILIAIPSFALLYATDELVDPSLTVQVIGHQWYRSYEYNDLVTSIVVPPKPAPLSTLLSSDIYTYAWLKPQLKKIILSGAPSLSSLFKGSLLSSARDLEHNVLSEKTASDNLLPAHFPSPLVFDHMYSSSALARLSLIHGVGLISNNNHDFNSNTTDPVYQNIQKLLTDFLNRNSNLDNNAANSELSMADIKEVPTKPPVVSTRLLLKQAYERFLLNVSLKTSTQETTADNSIFLNGSFAFDSYMRQEPDLNIGEMRLYETDFPLVLPKYTHIRFMITADDVIHSRSVPALGIKVDAVPGRINHAHTYIKYSGIYYGQCSELRGVNHAFMPIQILVFDPQLYYDYIRLVLLSK